MQVLLDETTALAAILRCVARVDCHDLNSGLDSLVVQKLVEQPKCNIMRSASKVAVAKHQGEVQILQDNCAILVHQPPSDLVPPVAALVRDVLQFLCQLLHGFLAALAALLSTGNTALEDSQALQRLLQILRAVNDCAVTQRQRVLNANIDTNGRITRQRRRFDLAFDLKAYIPAGRLANNDDVLELSVRESAMPLDGHQANILNVKPPVLDRRACS